MSKRRSGPARSERRASGQPGGPRRYDRFCAAGLFVAALGLRLAHLATIRESPFFQNLILDPRMYDEWGQRIAAGLLLGQRPFFQDPLYAYFLGLLYAACGHDRLPVLLVQALLGSLVPVLVFLGARPWFGRPAATAAGLIATVYLPSVYYGGLILKTWMTVVLVALALWLLSRALIREDRGAVWLWIGICAGLACLTRGNLVLLIPLLAAWTLVGKPAAGSRPLGADRLRPALLTLLGAGLALAPATLHNRFASGEWILTTSNAGQNFYIGNNPLNRTGEYERLPFVDANPQHEETGFAAEARRRAGRDLSAGEVSSFWFSRARAWALAEPQAWAALFWRKLRLYWAAYEIPDNLDYYLYRETAPLLRLPVPGFGLVAPLGLLGAILAWKRRGWPRLLILFVAIYSLSVVLFFVFSRFRMAMMPALFALAGFSVVELWSRLRSAMRARGSRAPLLRAAGLLLILLAAVNLPVRARAESRSYRLARALALPARPETSSIGHYNLGLSLAALAGESADPEATLRQAETHLREAVRREPGRATMRIELGKVLARRGRDREAIEVYRGAVTIEPGNYRIHHALGLLYRREGNAVAAEASFRRALALAPSHAASATRLGEVLLEQGRTREAAEAFRHALRLAPGDRSAAEGLRAAEATAASGP